MNNFNNYYHLIGYLLILLLMGCAAPTEPPTEPPIELPTESSGAPVVIEAEYPFKVRIRNNSDQDLENIEMTLAERSESISKVAAGEVSEYVTFGEVRQLPTLTLLAGETEYVWEAEQGAGERLLLGEFTYEVDFEDGVLNVGALTENALLQDAQLYAEQTGVSLSEALSRFELQESQGDDIGELQVRLAQEQRETFAGLWLEHEPTYRVVVAFTRDGEQTIQPYIESSPLADQIEVRSAEVSLAELEAIQEETTRLVEQFGISASIATSIQNNHVELNVTDRARLDAALAEANATLSEHVVVNAIYEPVGDNPPFDITPEPSIFMPQLQIRTADVMEALLIGELVVEEGCLRVQSGEESELVIWQADYYLNNRDGTLEILNETGEVVARVGEKVYMGGGYVPFTPQLEAGLREPIPEACGKPQGVWLMGEFLPEEYRENVEE